MKIASRHLAVAAVAVATAGGAPAQDMPLLRQRSLAATCTQCHGSAGRALDGATVPGLAGLPAAYLVEQMKAFRSGARPASVMQQLAKGYSDAQIERVAAYFAAQKP